MRPANTKFKTAHTADKRKNIKATKKHIAKRPLSTPSSKTVESLTLSVQIAPPANPKNNAASIPTQKFQAKGKGRIPSITAVKHLAKLTKSSSLNSTCYSISIIIRRSLIRLFFKSYLSPSWFHKNFFVALRRQLRGEPFCSTMKLAPTLSYFQRTPHWGGVLLQASVSPPTLHIPPTYLLQQFNVPRFF